jgi:2-dehydro-3-deoxyphosphogluconate aldolase/(4S)-4-hydroxy-2-oxoglutarate aldolase
MNSVPSNATAAIDALMAMGPVIPVIVIDDVAHAQPLAAALVAGGVRVLEVTLRTPVALEAIALMAQVEGAVVGAGTVTTPAQLNDALTAGARFAVSPGLTMPLAHEARRGTLPLLPGVVTPAEVMAARDHGFERLKFFPAEPMGGLAVLKAYASVFAGVRFCPTGGITITSAPAYLAQANIGCVGGSWLSPAAAQQAGRWAEITELARQAQALRPTL